MPASSQHDSALFMRPTYLALGDLYQDGDKLKLRETKPNVTPFNIGVHHYRYPSQFSQTLYPYKELGPQTLLNHRDDSGKVKAAPKGFYTNPLKKGIANATTK